jgi:outer membrane protein
LLFGSISAAKAAEGPAVESLDLDTYVRRVLDYNENVQIRLIEWEISRRKYLAERGIFEPEFVGSVQHEANRRANTAEQRRSQGLSVFDEENNNFNTGIEVLSPTGGKVHLGYGFNDLNNNIQDSLRTGAEYQTTVGATLTQPLLKNFGPAATMANIRLAAISSDIAFQEYRRQMMLLISQAEAAYWDLYLAQEQLALREDSVRVAEKIVEDSEARIRIGKSSEQDVLQAQAAVALRKTKLAETQQKLVEGVNRIRSLSYAANPNASPLYTGGANSQILRATQRPEVDEASFSYFEAWQNAFEHNPDYLSERKKISGENIQLAFMRNQRLPVLDLKASYGLNGLGTTPALSFEDVEHRDFPSWSVGVEMRIPLGGGIKSKNDLAAAKLSHKRALLRLKDLETQISISLDSAIRKIESARTNLNNYDSVIVFSKKVLDNQLVSLDLGKGDMRKVFQAEDDLADAKNSFLELENNYQKARLEFALLKGTVLKARGMDLTKEQLQARTSKLARRSTISDEEYRDFMQELRADFGRKPPAENPEQKQALQELRKRMQELNENDSHPTP